MDETKYMWVSLRKTVEANEWVYSDSQVLSSRAPMWCSLADWRYETNITYVPELNVKSSVNLLQSYMIHRKVCFNIGFMLSKNSTHLGFRIGYVPRDREEYADFHESNGWDEPSSETHAFLEHFFTTDKEWYCKADEPCRKFFWAYDQCYVKVHLLNRSGKSVFAKRFNMEYMEDDGEPADFVDPSFITVGELKHLLGFDSTDCKKNFLSVVIEISSSLFLDVVTCRDEYFWEDDESLYRIPCPTSQNMASNKRIKLSNIAQSHEDSLCPDSEDCDLVIEIGADTRDKISVHTMVLAVRSPVFRTMFKGSWKEMKVGKLNLKENSSPGVKAFINYLYFSKSNAERIDQSISKWPVNLSLEVLKLGHFYQVMDLVEYCVDHIFMASNSEFNLTFAVDVFQAGQLYDIQDLTRRSLQWMKKSRYELVVEDGVKGTNFVASACASAKRKNHN